MAIPIFDDLDMHTNRVTDTSDPVVDTDAATKRYVDIELRKLDWKHSVRVASTGNVNLAAPGAAIDGVALVIGDRFLAWQQTLGAENGIYVWNGAAVPATRSLDADENTEVTSQMLVPVSEGTVNADRSFRLITNDPITVGVTPLVFVVDSPSRFVTLFGDGVTQTLPVNHNLNADTVHVSIREIATGDYVLTRITRVNANTFNLRFTPAAGLNAFEVAVSL